MEWAQARGSGPAPSSSQTPLGSTLVYDAPLQPLFPSSSSSSSSSSSHPKRHGTAMAEADSSDPRMPAAARKRVLPELLVNSRDLPPVYAAWPAIIFGLVGFTMREKVASWVSLVFIAQSLALMKNPEVDVKQILYALMFAVMGLARNYFGLF